MYIDILHHCRYVVRRKHPKNWRTNSWFLLHDNGPAHWSFLVKISLQRTMWNVNDMIFNYFCLCLFLVKFTCIASVNKEMYIDILHRCSDVVRRKHTKNWRTNNWFLLQNNAPGHWSVLVKISLQRTRNVSDIIFNYFCHQCNWCFESTLLSSSWSSVYLFLWLTSAMNWWCFCGATDVIKNVTKELKGCHKMVSRIVSNTFTVISRSVKLHKGAVLKEL